MSKQQNDTMRTLPCVLALLFVTAVGVRPGDACICDPPPYWTRAVTAPEVFAGTITSVRETTYSWQVRVRIERSWKGSLRPGTIVSLRVDDSRRKLGRFAVGQRWMLFAGWIPKRGAAPILVSSDCYGNWRVTKRAPLPFLPPPPSLPDPAIPASPIGTPQAGGGSFGSGAPASSW